MLTSPFLLPPTGISGSRRTFASVSTSSVAVSARAADIEIPAIAAPRTPRTLRRVLTRTRAASLGSSISLSVCERYNTRTASKLRNALYQHIERDSDNHTGEHDIEETAA